MEILRDIAGVRAFVAAARRRGARIGFVPTMGFLHDGHLSLMRAARRPAEARAPALAPVEAVVIASIFVNPTQFGPNEDFSRYPRDEAGDLEKCRAAGCDAVFLPPVEVMYPAGHRTTVHVDALTGPLCGASRPGHFDGVCTVVLKLFSIVGCDVALFGEKDYQQLAVIRKMATDLDLPVEVRGHPIVREADGLAMSSRNVYLDPTQRVAARSLSAALAATRAAFEAGERGARTLEAVARGVIEAAPGADIDYIEIRDAVTLAAVTQPIDTDVVLALAVRFGRTRLIDNTVLAV
jgi:pantoate--beta-alanine ligase